MGIVGDLSGFEAQPAAAGEFAVDAMGGGDLAGGHKFDGCSEGVADGEAEICA